MSPTPKRPELVQCPYCGTTNDPQRGSKRCLSCKAEIMRAEVTPFTFPATGQPVLDLGDAPAVKGLESHLYVVEFGRYGVKVGITANPKSRLAQHARDGRNFGRPATRGWLSPPHAEAKDNERALIAFCNKRTRAVRSREYFTTPFQRVHEYASTLPMSRGDREAFEAHAEAVADGFISIVMGGLR